MPGPAAPPIAETLARVRARIAGAARRAGRRPEEVTVVGATKLVPVPRLAEALEAGLAHLGENRAQDLVAKAAALAGAQRPPVWHFIGRLQRNKVRMLAPHVTWWHSVDRLELGAELARRAPAARVLVEVNVAAEPTKAGCRPAEVTGLVAHLRGLGLDVRGLMTVPPAGRDPRPTFAALRGMAEGLGLPELSMGMSDDFEAAVEEGATMVRIGRALFGERPSTGTVADGHPPAVAPPLS